LIQLDIECRLHAGQPALLAEPYFEHPRLRQPDTALDAGRMAELIRREYHLRWRRGQRARRQDYADRFPACVTALGDLRPGAMCPRCGRAEVSLAEEPGAQSACPGCGATLSAGDLFPTDTRPATIDGNTPRAGDMPATLAPPESGWPAPMLRRLGRYQVGEEIARGGMGHVCRARDPELDRELAVKTLRPELRGSPGLVRRFLDEARITAQLPHPGIVPVHDIGRDENGLPFLVLKLVQGQTLERLLAARAGPAEDLPRFVAIFEQLCQAVAFAHSRGVIHRDLKPANVMVGAFGEVQLMDWGLAKARLREEMPAEPDPATHTAEMSGEADEARTQGPMGTPHYMPPEQARGDWGRVDERADVFALGGILCAMLTGRPPFTAATPDKALRKAAEADLADAHARLDSCGADTALVELAWTCLSPEAAERPRDGAEVAQRVAAYQVGVQKRLRRAERERAAAEAREEQATARARAERRARHRAAALAAVAMGMVATAVVAFVLVAHQRQLALHARDDANNARELADARADENKRLAGLAQAQADKARRVAEFLAGTFEASDPLGLNGKAFFIPKRTGEKLDAHEMLRRGAQKCERDLHGEPEIRAAILEAIGNAFRSLGYYAEARKYLETALDLRRRHSLGTDADRAAILHGLGQVYHEMGEHDAAEPLYLEALEIRRALPPPDDLPAATTMFNLGWLLTERGDMPRARAFFEQALRLRQQRLPEQSRDVAVAKLGLAAYYLEQDDFLRAAPLTLSGMATFQRVEGASNLTDALGKFQKGIALLRAGDEAGAFGGSLRKSGYRLLEEALTLTREALGPDHIMVAFILGTLANERDGDHEDDRARAEYEACLRIVRATIGFRHPLVGRLVLQYGGFLASRGHHDQAERLYAEFLAEHTRGAGPTSPRAVNVLVKYARALERRGQSSQAEAMYLDAVRRYRRFARSLDHESALFYGICTSLLAQVHLRRQEPRQAEAWLREEWPLIEGVLAGRPADRAARYNTLAAALLGEGRYDGAELAAREALVALAQLRRARLQPPGFDAAQELQVSLDRLTALYLATSQVEKAVAISRRRVKEFPREADQLYTAGWCLLQCVLVLDRAGAPPGHRAGSEHYLAEAVARCRKAAAIYRNRRGPPSRMQPYCLHWLAYGLCRLGAFKEADGALADALPLVVGAHGEWGDEYASCMALRGRVLAGLGRHREARACYRAALGIFERRARDKPRGMLWAVSGLAQSYRETGDLAGAMAAARLHRLHWPGDPGQLLEAACEMALCVPTAAQSQGAGCAGEALAALRQSLELGYSDVGRLAGEPRLAAVRGGPEFAALAARCEHNRQTQLLSAAGLVARLGGCPVQGQVGLCPCGP
jgi:tetratricopeptide (TPR) repeat protein